MSWMSTYVVVEISPDTTTSPVFTSVSQATRPFGSSRITASSTPSEIWSAILSGWPSVTDSEVKRYSFSDRFVLIRGGVTAPRFGGENSTGPGRNGQIRVGEGYRAGAGAARLPRAGVLVALLAAAVVDHQRHALESVARAQAVLEEEA